MINNSKGSALMKDLLKTTSDIPIEVDRILIEEKYEEPVHFHSHYDVYTVIRGTMEIRVSNGNWILHAGDSIFVNTDDIHNISIEQLCEFIHIMIPKLIIAHTIDSYFLYEIKLNTVKNPELLKLQAYIDLRKRMIEISDLWESKKSQYRILIHIKFYEFMYLIANDFSYLNITDDIEKKKLYISRVQKIVDRIDHDFNQDLSLECIANELGIEYHYFSRFFKKYMGMTYKEYVNHVRLNRAINDLLNTTLSITTVALDNGFGSVKSFTRIFKKNYGITPGEYRKQHLSNKEQMK